MLYVLFCRYRFLWLIITVGGLTAAIKTSVFQVMDYYEWPYYMLEYVVDNRTIPVPDITICNAFSFPNLGSNSKQTRAILDDINDRKCFKNRSMRAFLIDEVSAITP